ncbi:cupredoxin domain-containing protein [Arthrobacter bambusae]|uniref:cupredoxin domain-containing protein n=1 Tax=Arthrobacter bambusae TaxID=1338426 RepID=UPI002781212E|nr:cupredoxin domain-containing protein [Arthrobacter bambusae]MDQ0213573.1 plastocyanin [Arthrobacter bambusae]MDQ0237908.1 plastocyanin [Arthrobacter bambusae]
MVLTSSNHRTAALRFGLLAGAAALALSACASAGNSPAAQPASSAPASAMTMDSGMGGTPMASAGTAATATIHIKSFAYSGPDSVPAGAEVTVMNMDTEAHTVTADDGSFDAVVKAGTSVTFTAPKKPGTYAYHCTYHSNMHGTLTVK